MAVIFTEACFLLCCLRKLSDNIFYYVKRKCRPFFIFLAEHVIVWMDVGKAWVYLEVGKEGCYEGDGLTTLSLDS